MGDFIYLLWLLISGLFKLVWAIISFPFKCIRNILQKKKLDAQKREENLKLQNKLNAQTQEVENLFSKIKPDVLTPYKSSWPKKIIITINQLTMFYNDGYSKTLEYSHYNCKAFNPYSTYWCTDETESETNINQELLLAEKINHAFGNRYSCRGITKENISDCGTETLLGNVTIHKKMYSYFQTQVEMT